MRATMPMPSSHLVAVTSSCLSCNAVFLLLTFCDKNKECACCSHATGSKGASCMSIFPFRTGHWMDWMDHDGSIVSGLAGHLPIWWTSTARSTPRMSQARRGWPGGGPGQSLGSRQSHGSDWRLWARLD